MAVDPFFSLTKDSDWNATIGSQGDVMNYADGYIEAALELAALILKERRYGQRDTLVLPILYNARHSIELHLKLVIGEFVKAGIIASEYRANHDIASHLNHLSAASVPDEEFGQVLSELAPFVESLARIDDDGQELRYSKNRDGKRSLDDHALANIAVILESLEKLKKLLDSFKFRASDLCDEYNTETRTKRLSRKDLFAIADLLPERSDWNDPTFDTAKQAIRERFEISNTQFSAALNVIQDRRELKAIIGIETPLVHLSDVKAIDFVKQWKLIHPPREPFTFGVVSKPDFAEIMKDRETDRAVTQNIEENFSLEEIADAETIFYLARENTFSEYYERDVASKIQEYKASDNIRQEIHDIIYKTNFLSEFHIGVCKLGRIKLAQQLEKVALT